MISVIFYLNSFYETYISSDGVLRIFSSDPSRQASDDVLAIYESEVTSTTKEAEKHLGGINVSE